MAGIKKKALHNDSRWPDFVERYAFDLPRFAVEVCGMEPTEQQFALMGCVNDQGSRTSVRSGHGTGKTRMIGVIGTWHLLCYYMSNTLVTAPKIEQVKNLAWKEFQDIQDHIARGPFAWLVDYYVIEAERIYVINRKAQWYLIAKTAPRGSPENMAGMHRDWLLIIGDEASGIPDANMAVLTGALTDARNRMLLTSQPTRQSGFFYDTHNTLSKEEGGAWDALCFDSELSPLVSIEFILEKRLQYTDEEYTIKVKGEFPETSSKYLIGPKVIEACVGRTVIAADDDYGWIIPVDVGGGGYRDETTILALKVAGDGEYGDNARRAQLIRVPLCSNTKDVSDLHGDIIVEAGLLSNASVLIDAGGIGLGVCKQLDKDGFTNYSKIYWGSPNFKKEYKERYVNQRAQAICGLSRAVQDGRFGVDASIPLSFVKKMVKQGSRVPYHYDDKARRYIAKKEEMRKEGIPSPDVWDSLAFVFLEDASYIIADDAGGGVQPGIASVRRIAEDAFADA